MHSTPLDGMMTFGAGTRLILEYLKVDHITASGRKSLASTRFGICQELHFDIHICGYGLHLGC